MFFHIKARCLQRLLQAGMADANPGQPPEDGVADKRKLRGPGLSHLVLDFLVGMTPLRHDTGYTGVMGTIPKHARLRHKDLTTGNTGKNKICQYPVPPVLPVVEPVSMFCGSI
jgi:hypothetical protein